MALLATAGVCHALGRISFEWLSPMLLGPFNIHSVYLCSLYQDRYDEVDVIWLQMSGIKAVNTLPQPISLAELVREAMEGVAH